MSCYQDKTEVENTYLRTILSRMSCGEPLLGMMIHQFKQDGGPGVDFAVGGDKLYDKIGECSGLKLSEKGLLPLHPSLPKPLHPSLPSKTPKMERSLNPQKLHLRNKCVRSIYSSNTEAYSRTRNQMGSTRDTWFILVQVRGTLRLI